MTPSVIPVALYFPSASPRENERPGITSGVIGLTMALEAVNICILVVTLLSLNKILQVGH